LLSAAETFATEPLSTLETGELVDRLESIWGFDSWAAEYVAIEGFGRMDRPPRYDPALRGAIEELYGLPEATDDHLKSLSNRYGRHAGYWANYVTTWAESRTESTRL
jgi:3-methyladenine DNA glycosylase/8-oxoguanine DNA glycosylase